ncbi:MAG: DUF5666 domain-containing protein [Acidobacteriota bacterium]
MRSSFVKLSSLLILVLSLLPIHSSALTFTEDVKFTGIVQALPSGGFIGDWRVADKVVHASSSTIINHEDGVITVGATVKVEGFPRSDGSIDATEIELRQASPNPSPGDISFKGTIQSFPSSFVGDWQIGGKVIHATASTRIEAEVGPVAVGAFAEVKGTLRADGSMDATKIEIQSSATGGDGRSEITAIIEQLPSSGLIGDWQVGGRAIHVTSSTMINLEHGAAVVGALVEVKGSMRTDGSMDATSIEVKSGSSSGGGSGSGSGGGGQDDDRNELHGIVQSFPSGLIGDWSVSGRTVHVTSSTIINLEHGQVAVGVLVEVKGTTRADGSLDAATIEVKTASSVGSSSRSGEGDSLSVKGAIQTLPGDPTLIGDWKVKDRTIHVTTTTKLSTEHGAFSVGKSVKVKGLTLADGSVLATKVILRDSF